MSEEISREELINRVNEIQDVYPFGNEIREQIIAALSEEPITWITGNDGAQVAVRNMPLDKMQLICAVIGYEEDEE